MAHYRLTFADPAGHLLDVEMIIAHPEAQQQVSLPVWIPGSYLVREFAKNIVQLGAFQNDQPRSINKLDKTTWQIACDTGQPLSIRYRVYAWDRSVRTCYFDVSRGFVNPAASLLRNDAAPDATCTLQVLPLHFAEGRDWRCATAMTYQAVDERGFGAYHAANYDELIDHPLECGDFDEFSFEAGGVPHRFVISGRHRGDLERLRRDSEKICQSQSELFAHDGDARAPFDRYLFQLHVVDEGYGGLEHRASTALISPRESMPIPGESSLSEGYRDLLGLISHEYFHSWNVKRIKPAAFTPYALERENYTRLLWLFEGITSYYDDLMVKRCNLITEGDYLLLLGQRITQLLRVPGRHVQSVADASFDAWTKFYRADENAPNAQVSYYLKGSLIALALDLQLRARVDGPTLDDVMRVLWREFGQTGVGVEESPVAWFSRVCEVDLGDFFARLIDGTEDPDWTALFAPLGIHYQARPASSASDRGGRSDKQTPVNLRQLGLIVNEKATGLPTIKNVLANSAAWRAGLSAGDSLIALDGLRANASTLGKHLARFQPGESFLLTYFRHDVLSSTTVEIPVPEADTAWLELQADADTAAVARRAAWLGNAV